MLIRTHRLIRCLFHSGLTLLCLASTCLYAQDVLPGRAAKCCTPAERKALDAAAKNAFAGVFYANRFDYLSDPCYNGPAYCGDGFKQRKHAWGTFSFGGESRFRYHDERNHRGLGITGRDDDFLLFRQRLYANWKINDTFRFYIEGLHADSYGETFAPRPIEVNDMDIQNLFVDVNLLNVGDANWTARLGRQELLYGAQRTVSPLDWANTRRTFEGVKLLYQDADTSWDVFWTEFVPVAPNEADHGESDLQFYGTYLTQKGDLVDQWEAYYLGFDNQQLGFSYHTFGGRISGATENQTLYDVEAAVQLGDNSGPSDHDAGFVTLGLGRKLGHRKQAPTVWMYYDYASGEDDFNQVARGDDGYDHLFPLAHKYNGFMDLFGRRNLHDLNVLMQAPLGRRTNLILWYHYFVLAQDTTPYSVVMTPYNTAARAGDRELGHELDVLFNIHLNPRNNVLVGYSHFFAGDYYDSTAGLPAAVAGGGADADFVYLQFQSRY